MYILEAAWIKLDAQHQPPIKNPNRTLVAAAITNYIRPLIN